MVKSNRRKFFLGGVAAAGLGAIGISYTFRIGDAPKLKPFLTPGHLSDLAATSFSPPAVLFIGNSMVLRNDLPGVVAAKAANEGHSLSVATAAANGARLVRTVRLEGLVEVLEKPWAAIVVQDFTKTPLRANDRWASRWAVRQIARMSDGAPLLLYPPFPGDKQNGVYRNAGRLTATPDDPEDFAQRTLAHYGSLGHPVAPVPQNWLSAVQSGAQLYEADGHHPNASGTDLVAEVLWEALKPVLSAE